MTTVSTRTYGIEIECLLPEGRTRANAAAYVAERLGKPCVSIEAYSQAHINRPTWKIVTDGSLSSRTLGMEVVSPALQGEEGFAEITTVMNALQAFGATVDKSCGFHVHVGTEADLRLHKTLAKLYAAYESVIDQIMPKSRRGNDSVWCRSLAHASRDQIDNAYSMSALCAVVRPGTTNQQRYSKLNMTRRHPTVEFRQHSGTLEPEKAITWTKTCLRMVDKSAAGVEFSPVTPSVSRPKVRRNSKRAICVDMLLRPEGATREQLLAATGWPTISVQDVVSRTGWELISTRVGRRITYRLNRAAAEATSGQLEISLSGLCRLIGSTDNERQYLEMRAANLSSALLRAA